LTDASLIDWLLSSQNPITRYRAVVDLAGSAGGDESRRLLQAVLDTAAVGYWLSCLDPGQRVSFNTIHGSFDGCFENAMGKLVQFGLTAGTPALDERTRPYRDWLDREARRKPDHVFRTLERSIVASSLAAAGYLDGPVAKVLTSRLASIRPNAAAVRTDIHAPPERFRGIPKAFRGRPVIDPSFYPDSDFLLPWVHDLRGMSALAAGHAGGEPATDLAAGIDTVARFAMAPGFQALPGDYGILASPGGRYHAMGWGVRLPGYVGPPDYFGAFADGLDEQCFVLRMALMASFPAARSHPWFRLALDHLERFRTAEGKYVLPKQYLREGTGYWIGGSHMGLGTNRRSPTWLEEESTFWALLIKRTEAGERA
jgi:hypothetical protein